MGLDGHFRAFSFVDRITSLEDGVRIRGCYTIPAGIETFPAALVAEAVGQLAAWAAMSAVEFQSRPVAGLAANIDLLAEVRPGQVLELAAELETLDAEAAAYDGVARVNGTPVIQLRQCVGPMVPAGDFDDPQALRERFVLLRGQGAAPGAFGGVPPLTPDRSGGEAGRSLRAILHVPEQAAFFADHFPRRPVLPGSLLMKSDLELVAALAAGFPVPQHGGHWVPKAISNMKLRTFTPPGEVLEMEASLEQLLPETASVVVENRSGKRLIGGARVRLVLEGCS